jgi:phosphoglycerate-specific signal transduction histidine kinase
MAMKLTYKELEQRIKHLERQACDLRREWEDRLQRERLQGVLEMAGAVCHELNQPMQVLSAYCERSLKTAMEGNSLNGVIVRKLERIASYETKVYIEGKRIIDIDKACRAA